MKLTKMADGRWLLEIEDIVTPLEAFQVAQLADLLEVKPVEWGPVRELRRELDEAHVEVDNYAAGAESLRKTIAGLRSELESAKDKAGDFRLMAADRELELVKLRQKLAEYKAEAKIRIERLQEQNDSLREANARLDAELAKYKATRATGGPWRPADQTWVSADIEPPASASDDTAPPLFRGLTVDKKETA